MLITLSVAVFFLLNLNCAKQNDNPGPSSQTQPTQKKESRPGEASRLSQPFPSLLLKDLNDRVVPSDQILAGKKSVVIFLSTTCQPCTDEIERWKPLHPNLEPAYQVIGISAEPIAELALYSQERQINFPVYSDASELLVDYFSISTYPTIVGVTPDRIVKFIRPGYAADLKPAQYLQAF